MTKIEYKIKVIEDNHKYWQWACDNLIIGTWKKYTGFMGASATYSFYNEEDSTAFKLKFGL